jgi:hypothetical protein
MVRFITVFCLCITIAALMGLPPGKTARAASITVTADFGTRVDYPLIKSKFGVYNSGTSRSRAGCATCPHPGAAAGTGAHRAAMGDEHDGWPSVITGAASNLQYNFTQLDSLIDALNNANLSPVIGYGYNPVLLQPSGGQWNNPPSPLDA